MRAEVPVFARVPETAAGDIQAPSFRGDRRADKNQNQRGQDQQSPAIKKSEDEREAAKDFEPGQINCKAHTNEPRQGFVIVDVVRKLDRIERFDRAGVNENSADNKIDNTPRVFHLGDLSHSSQPPCRTKTSLSCASSRNRFATSRAALQLSALQ